MSEIILLNNVTPYQQNVNVNVIVLDPGVLRRTHTGAVVTMKVADSSGSINLTVFNPEFDTFAPGDILKVRCASGNVYQGRLCLALRGNGEIKKTGEFVLPFAETPAISEQPLPAGTVDPRMQRPPPSYNRPPPGN